MPVLVKLDPEENICEFCMLYAVLDPSPEVTPKLLDTWPP